MGSLLGASTVSVPFYEVACMSDKCCTSAVYSNGPYCRGTSSVLALVRREPAWDSFQRRATMSGVLHVVFCACTFAHLSFHSSSSPIV